MKNVKKQNNNMKNNKLLLVFTIAVVLLISLLAINSNGAKASSDFLGLESKACAKCNKLDKDTVFNQNSAFVRDAAINYFTNERLPQKVGSKETITLGKMIEEKLIRNIVDSNGNNCSLTESYVEVTKKSTEEYVFKINLSCSDLVDYILVYKGCTDYCGTSSCNVKPETEEKTYEYEYKKSTACIMGDWSDWTDWSTIKETIENPNYKREETKTEEITEKEIEKIDVTKETKFNCDQYEGYELLGNLCVRSESTLLEEDAELHPTTYNCDALDGYTLDKTGKICTKEITETDEKPAKPDPTTYNCDEYEGYELDSTGKKCVKKTETKDEKPAKPNPTTYNCDDYDKYDLDKTGTKCIKTIYDSYTVAAEPVYSTRKVPRSCKIENCSTKPVLDCSSGSCVYKDEKTCTYVESTCYDDVEYVSGYYCSEGTQSGSSCIISSSYVDEKPGKPNPTTYNCNDYDGYRLNTKTNMCEKTITTTDEKPGKPNPTTYNCNEYDGYKLNTKTNMCEKVITTTDEKPAKENPKTYNCDEYDGYKLNTETNMCVKTTTTTDEKPGEPNPDTYNCDKYDGYTLVGNKCVKPKCEICSKEAAKEEIETCPEGYTLENGLCIKEVEKTKKVTYYRYSTRTCDGGSTETKWSTDKNDVVLKAQGFKFTGRTRYLVLNK